MLERCVVRVRVELYDILLCGFPNGHVNIISPLGINAYFDGTGYIQLGDTSRFVFGSSDFTIECWVYFTSSPAVAFTIFDKTVSYSGNTLDIRFEINVNRIPSLAIGPNPTWYGGSTGVALSTRTHVAFSRNGNTIRSYINGVMMSSQTTSQSVGNYSSTAQIGATCDNFVNKFNGVIDELRISSVGHYPAAFTVPTVPFDN